MTLARDPGCGALARLRAAASKTATGALDAPRARWDPSSFAFFLGARAFKDSDGGFRRAYGQLGLFLGAQTNGGLEREGEKRT